MRKPILCTLLVAGAACQPVGDPTPPPAPIEASTNAVDVDPDTHRVELENDWVRVIRYQAPPGYVSNRHTHVGGAYVSLSNGASSTTIENGDTAGGKSQVGDTGAFFEFAGVMHTTENVGTTDIEEILIEVKVDGGAASDPPSHDAVQVDPAHHTIEFENDLIRLIRMKYPEGYVTPPHNHYPGVNVFISDVTAASGPDGEDGDPVTNASGVATWADTGEPHVTRNLGGELHIVRVELKVQ